MRKNYVSYLTLILFTTTTSCRDFFNTTAEDQFLEAPKYSEKKEIDANPFGDGFIEPQDRPFSEEALILNFGLNVISPLVQNFNHEIQLFNLLLKKDCQSEKSDFSESVFQQWQKVSYSFHQVDALAMGPMLEKNSQGLDTKIQLYSWPITNACQIDRAAHEFHFQKNNLSTLPYNSKGLDAVEYLLYADKNKVTCNLKAYPYLQNWINLDETQKFQSRCQTAAQLTNDLSALATQLDKKWDRKNGNYTKKLTDGSVNGSFRQSINQISNSLFFIETIKDQRLGIPTGKNNKECPSGPCLQGIENFKSEQGLKSIQARLESFKIGFLGSRSNQKKFYGIDDYLNHLGHKEISERMLTKILFAEKNLNDLILKGSLNSHLLNLENDLCQKSTSEIRHVEICSLYEDIKAINTILKTEVLIALSLSAPPIYQGDND